MARHKAQVVESRPVDEQRTMLIMRAVAASGDRGLNEEQIETLVPDSRAEFAALLASERVEASYRWESQYIATAYGRAWLAVRVGGCE